MSARLRERWEQLYRHAQSIMTSGTLAYTPAPLVRQLVQQVPLSVQQSLTAKWLDPCCGRGTFLAEIFVTLMETLSTIVSDERMRAQSIVKRLHGSDIDDIQLDITRRTFNDLLRPYRLTSDDLQLNCADSLEYDFGVKFDVIVGNPPYNPPKQNGKPSGNKIWHRFIERAFELAKDDGHLLCITPPNWRHGNFKKGQHHKAQKLMFANHIVWWQNFPDYFPTDVDAWHVMKNATQCNLPTTLRKLCVLPKTMDTQVMKHVAQFFNVCMHEKSIEYAGCLGKKWDVFSNAKSAETPYAIANTAAAFRENKLRWVKEKPPFSTQQKVLVSDSRTFIIGYDSGQIANGKHSAAYIIPSTSRSHEDGDRLISFLRSPLVEFITAQFKDTRGGWLPIHLFERLPKSLLTKPWQEVFNISDDDIQ